MGTEKWPEPSRDTSGYNFLYPFYFQGYEKTLIESPQHAIKMNMARADQLAVRLAEKKDHLLKAYTEPGFPAIDLADPCGILASLAVRLSLTDAAPSWMDEPLPHINVSLKAASTPKYGEDVPDYMRCLGRLEVSQYQNEEEPRVRVVELNQPGANNSIKLGVYPCDINRGRGRSYTDSYPANAQAMNFIGMVDEYLDKLEKNRLVIVGG